MRSLLSIAVLFLLSTFSIAQIAATPVNEWVKKLSDPKDKKNQASRFIVGQCHKFQGFIPNT